MALRVSYADGSSLLVNDTASADQFIAARS